MFKKLWAILLSFLLVLPCFADGQGTVYGTVRGQGMGKAKTTAEWRHNFPNGLTFYADYSKTVGTDAKQLLAKWAKGSPKYTFTRVTSASAPATHTDSFGKLNLLTTSDTPRFVGGYYDATGFHAIRGLLIEQGSTNYEYRSYFNLDSNADGLADGYNLSQNVTGSYTTSLESASDISNISGHNWQKISYTAGASDSNQYFLLVGSCPSATAASGDIFTGSFMVKGQASGVAFFPQLTAYDANSVSIINTDVSGSTISLSTSPAKVYVTGTYTSPSRSILSFADAGGGQVTVTLSSTMNQLNNCRITITGTTNYNGSYTISNVSGATFRITKAWAGNDATGTAEWPVDKVQLRLRTNDISNGDSFTIYATNYQVEKTPYPTSFIPTTSSALPRNADVLTYFTALNRTANEESIFIKFMPLGGSFANDGVSRYLISTGTKSRYMAKVGSGTEIWVAPNGTDSGPVGKGSGGTNLVNTSYVIGATMKHSSPYVTVYKDGVSAGSYTTGDWINPAWTAAFYIGSNGGGGSQFNGLIQEIAIFGRAVTASEANKGITVELNK